MLVLRLSVSNLYRLAALADTLASVLFFTGGLRNIGAAVPPNLGRQHPVGYYENLEKLGSTAVLLHHFFEVRPLLLVRWCLQETVL